MFKKPIAVLFACLSLAAATAGSASAGYSDGKDGPVIAVLANAPV